MSNYLAIATVTATLRRTLQSALTDPVSEAIVTALRPDSSATGLPTTGVNIYLYQVIPSAAWRAVDLPTRDASGNLTQQPRIGLDLHYLLTFYGEEANLGAERVLGVVVRTLHASPYLTPEQIRATCKDATFDYVALSDLAEEVERVKFTPGTYTLEELSNIWSILFQTPYALSLTYVASVVFIVAEETARRALPVRERIVLVSPFQRAVVEKIVSQSGETAPISFGDTVVIEGSALDGTISRIRVGVAELQPVAGSVRAARLLVTLDDPLLRAGVQGVQIVYQSGSESTVAAFVLRPVIDIDLAGITTSALPITFAPAVSRDQRTVVHLNELNPPSDRAARAYSFNAPAANGITSEDVQETAAITFAIADVVVGEYLVRAQVAGAENVLGLGEIGGVLQYAEPAVAIP